MRVVVFNPGHLPVAADSEGRRIGGREWLDVDDQDPTVAAAIAGGNLRLVEAPDDGTAVAPGAAAAFDAAAAANGTAPDPGTLDDAGTAPPDDVEADGAAVPAGEVETEAVEEPASDAEPPKPRRRGQAAKKTTTPQEASS